MNKFYCNKILAVHAFYPLTCTFAFTYSPFTHVDIITPNLIIFATYNPP